MVTQLYENIKDGIKKELEKDVRDLSFPRLVGSEGEPKARSLIKEKMKEAGFTPVSEPVLASYYRMNFLASFANILGGIFFIISSILFTMHPLLFIIPLILIFIQISMMSTGSPAGGQPPNVPKFAKVMETENIYAESDSNDGDIQIVLMGHWDSKSTKLSGLERIIAYLIFLVSAVGLLMTGLVGIVLHFVLANPAVNTTIANIMWGFSIAGIVAAIILAFNVVGNESPGACDNATSIANVLACMRYFKKNPIPGVNLTYLLTTAEEIGLTGAYNFILNRKDDPEWDPDKTYVINWDLAGLPKMIRIVDRIGIPKKQCSATMSAYVPEISKQQGFPVKLSYLPVGGWTDSLPFNYFGYESFTIASIGGVRMVHQEGDTPEILDFDKLFESWVLGIEIVKKIAAEKFSTKEESTDRE